jgi:hypothetical protein
MEVAAERRLWRAIARQPGGVGVRMHGEKEEGVGFIGGRGERAGRGRSPFLFSFFCFLDLQSLLGHKKIIRKIQIKSVWIPCEKGFKMDPLL